MSVECFITGGSGFIGQHLLAHLTARGHTTWALVRSPESGEKLQAQVRQLGGDPARLHTVQGDISKAGLGLSEADRTRIASARVVFHLAVQFAWGMTMEHAREVNVRGALGVASLAANQNSRLLMVGGYMVQNQIHLGRIGVNLDCPERTDWPGVYQRVGGYEASKIEAHFAVLRQMQTAGADVTVVHPATVCGHSESGHMVDGQPLADLIRNLACGKLTAVPGSAQHWLPLVSVDYLVKMIACAAFDPVMANQQVLALDDATPNLHGLLAQCAEALGRRAPRWHIPMGLLRGVLAVPGVARRLGTHAESLNFIQTQRFDMTHSQQLERRYQLAHPDLQRTLHRTVSYLSGL